MSIKKPEKYTIEEYWNADLIDVTHEVYDGKQMDAYLATKDAEIEELKTVNNAVALEIERLKKKLERISTPLCGSHSEWGKKELRDIINEKARLAEQALKEVAE